MSAETWTRTCPSCKDRIIYVNETSFKRALQVGKPCRACVQRNRRNKDAKQTEQPPKQIKNNTRDYVHIAKQRVEAAQARLTDKLQSISPTFQIIGYQNSTRVTIRCNKHNTTMTCTSNNL